MSAYLGGCEANKSCLYQWLPDIVLNETPLPFSQSGVDPQHRMIVKYKLTSLFSLGLGLFLCLAQNALNNLTLTLFFGLNLWEPSLIITQCLIRVFGIVFVPFLSLFCAPKIKCRITFLF